MVAVETPRLAPQLAGADMASQFLGGRLSARPCLSPGVGTCLIGLGGVDSLQANTCPGYLDAVAVEHPRPADQW